jgi:hypothetical protein
MSDLRPTPHSRMTVRSDQPLIGVIRQSNGHEVVDYFTDEADADAASPDEAVQAALSVIGAWSDLDLDEMLDTLDRIRHDSKPTPPIELPELDS